VFFCFVFCQEAENEETISERNLRQIETSPDPPPEAAYLGQNEYEHGGD
jgi:hypothetical protein